MKITHNTYPHNLVHAWLHLGILALLIMLPALIKNDFSLAAYEASIVIILVPLVLLVTFKMIGYFLSALRYFMFADILLSSIERVTHAANLYPNKKDLFTYKNLSYIYKEVIYRCVFLLIFISINFFFYFLPGMSGYSDSFRYFTLLGGIGLSFVNLYVLAIIVLWFSTLTRSLMSLDAISIAKKKK